MALSRIEAGGATPVSGTVRAPGRHSDLLKETADEATLPQNKSFTFYQNNSLI